MRLAILLVAILAMAGSAEPIYLGCVLKKQYEAPQYAPPSDQTLAVAAAVWDSRGWHNFNGSVPLNLTYAPMSDGTLGSATSTIRGGTAIVNCDIQVAAQLANDTVAVLQVLIHEVGHCLGYGHSTCGVMAPALSVRRNEIEVPQQRWLADYGITLT